MLICPKCLYHDYFIEYKNTKSINNNRGENILTKTEIKIECVNCDYKDNQNEFINNKHLLNNNYDNIDISNIPC